MIINLTHPQSTPDQRAAGVIDLDPTSREQLAQALTFNELPTREQLIKRANEVGDILATAGTDPQHDGGALYNATSVMLGGAPFFMAHLEAVVRGLGLRPVYAFSKRETVEAAQPDGTVRKVAVFRHEGFVGAGE